MNAIINTVDVPVQIFSTWTEDFTRYENMELLNYWLTTTKKTRRIDKTTTPGNTSAMCRMSA